MPPPGGDVIGRRRLDPHLDAFRALGATVEHGKDIEIKAPDGGLRPCDFFMDEPSVMGTENALMAAAATAGTTIIRNAACEPHVQDVARMLNKMGAAIEGIGSNVMSVHGVATLGGCEYTVSPDHIEIAVVHGARGRDRRRAADHRLRLRGPADDPDGLPPARPGLLDGGGRHLPRPRRPGAQGPARRRRLPVQGRGRPVARVPGRPHVDRRRARDPVRGQRPDLREDVREPAVLRGQADLDGGGDHDLRPAPGDRDRPAQAARRARLLARTSAPAWRC